MSSHCLAAIFTIITVFLTILTTSSANALTCGPGTYKQGGSWCSPCPGGTYISDLNHDFTECIECQSPQDHLFEYMAEKCTRTANTRILCTATYYRRDYPPEPALGECNKCSICGVGRAQKVLIQPCGDYTDTLCCENAQFNAKTVNDTLGRMFLECEKAPVPTLLDQTTFPPHASPPEQNKINSDTPSNGIKLISTGRQIVSQFCGLLCFFMCKYIR